MRHLGDNFWTADNFGTIWWFLSDFWQSIPLPRGQHIDIFKIRFYSILQHFERCECPICPNQKSCVTFNFQVYCSRLYLHNVHTLLTVFTQGSIKAHLDVTLGPLSTHLASFIHQMGQNGSIFNSKCQNFHYLSITAHPCWFTPSAANLFGVLQTFCYMYAGIVRIRTSYKHLD